MNIFNELTHYTPNENYINGEYCPQDVEIFDVYLNGDVYVDGGFTSLEDAKKFIIKAFNLWNEDLDFYLTQEEEFKWSWANYDCSLRGYIQQI